MSIAKYDLEDSLKANFTNPFDMLSKSEDIYNRILDELNSRRDKNDEEYTVEEIKDILYSTFGGFIESFDELNAKLSNKKTHTIPYIEAAIGSFISSASLCDNGYIRSSFTSDLVHRAINNVVLIPNKDCPPLSRVILNDDVKRTVEILKKYCYVVLINSSRLKIVEYRGRDIVVQIYKAIKQSTDSKRSNLLPEDFSTIYHDIDESERPRIICDFIAGMTDRYALEFYGRLFSEQPQTIYKPL